MTINTDDTIYHSALVGLGSEEYKTYTVSIEAQPALAVLSISPVYTFNFDTAAQLMDSRIQLEGIDDRWRPMVAWNGWTFDANNDLYLPNDRISLSDATARYQIQIVWFNTSTGIKFIVYTYNRWISGSPDVPAFNINWRIYLYTPPS